MSELGFETSSGKKITALKLEDDNLHFEFEDGSKMRIVDIGQSCCEYRYMQTDDDLADYIGAKLLSAEVAEAPNIENPGGDDHEVQFLRVLTDKGTFTACTHNIHNGYYGGFDVVVIES